MCFPASRDAAASRRQVHEQGPGVGGADGGEDLQTGMGRRERRTTFIKNLLISLLLMTRKAGK